MRTLARSLGMGGAASPSGSCLAYDPISKAVGAALTIPRPTYVDDLAALVRHPRQCQLALILLLAAGRCAGLHVETHV